MITNSASPMGRRGASSTSLTVALGLTTIVTAVANANGMILRTVTLSGFGVSQIVLAAGAPILALCPVSGQFSYLGAGIAIPPGVALTIDCSAAGGLANMSWDLL